MSLLKTLGEARMRLVLSLLPEKKNKDLEYIAQRKAGDFEDRLDVAYHEGFVVGYNQCREDILKRIKEEGGMQLIATQLELKLSEVEKYCLLAKIDKLKKRVYQLETFINTWKDVLLTNMTEEDFKEQLKEVG